MPILPVIELIASTLIAVAGVAISVAVYRHSRQERDRAWLEEFHAIHNSFWTDEDCATVRRWLSNPQSYQQLSGVLGKRKTHFVDVTPEEYGLLDKLDKFLNLMMRARLLRVHTDHLRPTWDGLFFDYWIKEATGKQPDAAENFPKDDLVWYVMKWYSALLASDDELLRAVRQLRN